MERNIQTYRVVGKSSVDEPYYNELCLTCWSGWICWFSSPKCYIAIGWDIWIKFFSVYWFYSGFIYYPSGLMEFKDCCDTLYFHNWLKQLEFAIISKCRDRITIIQIIEQLCILYKIYFRSCTFCICHWIIYCHCYQNYKKSILCGSSRIYWHIKSNSVHWKKCQ